MRIMDAIMDDRTILGRIGIRIRGMMIKTVCLTRFEAARMIKYV